MNDHDKMVEVDVREDLRLKKEPFNKIMHAIKELKDDQGLILHTPFNPVPLHAVLKRKGFAHRLERIEKKHWKVIYTRNEADIK